MKTRHLFLEPSRRRKACTRSLCLLLLILSTTARVQGASDGDIPPATTGVLPPQANLLEPELAPEQGLLPTPGVSEPPRTNQPDQIKEFQTRFELARKQRGEHGAAAAAKTLVALLETNVPPELKRPVLFELALAEQDSGQAVRAQQVFAQYLQLYPDDPTAPEVLLREGLLYRQMGITSMAISKFYAVMSTALKLKLDRIDYYKKLVLQAQVEIADTYYMEGKFEQASDYFNRLLKTGAEDLDKKQIQFKLIRSLASLTNHAETVAKARVFLEVHPTVPEVPEVRFVLASALKKLGRNQESMKQVLLLLQSQAETARTDPQTWAYWQRKAGTEIAGQLYQEGDNLNALEIYLGVSELDKSPAWQVPVWYQTALVYEQLQQWQKADETYQRILARRKELADKDATPALLSVFDMAGWRKDYIAWMQKARVTNQAFQRDPAAPGTLGGAGVGPMSQPVDILHDLQQHLDLCHELLVVVEREGRELRGPGKPSLSGLCGRKKALLPRLDKSLDVLKQHRVRWQKLSPEERARHPEIGRLLRQNQDLTMKIILLERENEQSLLRRGLVPPRQLPRAERQRPHFVAELYKRRGAA